MKEIIEWVVRILCSILVIVILSIADNELLRRLSLSFSILIIGVLAIMIVFDDTGGRGR